MSSQKKTILLVEDNQDDEDLTLRALRKGKISNEVIVVRDGSEAVDFLFASGKYAERNAEDLPTVVLLDLKLPKLSGLEVLKRIRDNEKTKLLPVVILTSSNEDKDIVNGYSLGANSYVCKPVEINDFISAVQQLGMYWLILNERAVDFHLR